MLLIVYWKVCIYCFDHYMLMATKCETTGKWTVLYSVNMIVLSGLSKVNLTLACSFQLITLSSVLYSEVMYPNIDLHDIFVYQLVTCLVVSCWHLIPVSLYWYWYWLSNKESIVKMWLKLQKNNWWLSGG